MGAQLIREVSSKTNDTAGDGTTTATVLAQAIFKEGIRNVAAGCNATQIKNGIEKAVDAIVAERWQVQARPSRARTRSSRSPPSAPNDPEIGELVAEIIDKVGKDGVVTVEESKSTETDLRHRRGSPVRQGLPVARTSSPTPPAWRRCSKSR